MIDDLGFYTVGNEKFYNKFSAIFRAQQTQATIHWNFNDEVFKAQNWLVEPDQTLDDLYRTRAQQIREEYDYVLMFCSGGADSTNMLFAFLDNGLHVDEIVASAPLSGLRDWDSKGVRDASVENTIEETYLTQIPFLQRIQTLYPKIKVTLHDYFEDMINAKSDEWLMKATDWMHPSMAGRYNLDRYTHLKRIAESGKKIAVVMGIDKPQILKTGDRVMIFFQDLTYNNKYDSINHPNSNPVFFYHCPQLPQLAVKQAHVAARYVFRPENQHLQDYMPFGNQWYNNENFNIGVYERGIVPAIYPSIKKGSYQAGKPDRMYLGKHDYWFYSHHRAVDAWQMMQSDIKNLLDSVDKKYLRYHDKRGLMGFESFKKFYTIGTVADFTKSSPTDTTSNVIIMS